MKEKGRVCQERGRAYYATENRRRGGKEKHICVCMSVLCVECLYLFEKKNHREEKQKEEARSKETIKEETQKFK